MGDSILLVITGSTRPSRVGGRVAAWVRERAEDHGAFEVREADLREIDLPLLDEPKHPRLREYEHEHTHRWSAMVDVADAFIFVHPEYNYGLNAATKNAIDYLHHEWKGKPAGVVSYGGVAAGQRAAQQLYSAFATLSITPAGAVPIPFVSERIDDRSFHPAEETVEGLDGVLAELERVTPALTALRESSLVHA